MKRLDKSENDQTKVEIEVNPQHQRRDQEVNQNSMIQRTDTKANKITNIRRGQHNRIIKGPLEKNHSNHSNHNDNIEEVTQIQNNIEIELNNSKINNTNYDIQSFTNEEESGSGDNIPTLTKNTTQVIATAITMRTTMRTKT